MSEQHDAAQHEAATQHDTQHSVFEDSTEGSNVPAVIPVTSSEIVPEGTPDTSPAKARRKPAAKPGAKPFKRRAHITDTDRVSFTLPHAIEKQLLAQRDRLDPPTDALDRKRHQQSRDDFLEAVVRHGLAIIAKLPDWKDPLQP